MASAMTGERWSRVEAVFAEAVALPRQQREASLSRACGADLELRREVESLLAADEEAEHFLARPALEATADSLVGRTLGPYRVEGELGEGGQGAVYLAVRADDAYQQKVALKVLGHGADRADLIARFRAERQILASLDHPGIARLLDGGATEDGRPYLVMEYIEGIPLDRYCDEHRLGLDQRIDLFRQVCASVDYAHQNLVVHRDLKPSNILVGQDGVPRLLDFGIAKLLQGTTLPGVLEPTRTGQRLMTPQYASPEQIEGHAITTASDVYSLGVLLYLLLTGRLPYRLQPSGGDSLERAVVEQVPERPSTAVDGPTLQALSEARGLRPQQLRRKLRGDLETILLTALRKEPSRRYGSVGRLAEDLRRYREGQPVLARPDTIGYRVRRFVGRHPVGVMAASVCLAVVVGLAATMTVQAVRLAHQRDEIRVERDKALEVRAFLEEVFSGSDPSETGGETVTAREILDKGASRVLGKLNGQPDTQAALALAIGKVYLSLGLADRAEPLLAQSLAQRLQLHGERNLDVADSLMALSVLDQNNGDFATAEERQRRALAIQRELLEPGDVRIGDSLTDLSVTLLSLARYADAEAAVKEALAIHRRSPDAREGVAYDLNNLGSVLRRSGRLPEAEAAYEEALKAARATFGPAHPQLTHTINNLAVVQIDRGELAAAEPLLREALAMTRKLYGDAHPDVALQLRNLSSLLGARGDTEAWVSMARQSLEMRRRLLGPEHEQVAMSLLNLGNALEEKRDFHAAQRLYEDALRIQRKAFGDGHPRVALALSDLAEMYLTLGDPKRAEPPAREALAIRREALSPAHADLGRSLSILGAVRLAAGSPEEAEPLLRQGLDVLRAALPPGHWRVGEAESRLGACLDALGKRGEAEPLLEDGYLRVLQGRGPASLKTQAALARLRARSPA
ncbi:MAG TPA: serine/threonine-protein kinase [Candidatus Polarisedimenticolaceae bacterium]|nr:serine/threonine-protein kinase [Candidatus Polarisedimenticolaceae bacterium]